MENPPSPRMAQDQTTGIRSVFWILFDDLSRIKSFEEFPHLDFA